MRRFRCSSWASCFIGAARPSVGTIDYATGLKLQQRLVELRKEGRIGDVLILLEHAPVITLGQKCEREEHSRIAGNAGRTWHRGL